MQLKQKLLVVCCFLHRSFTELHGRCPCPSVFFRCFNNFICCLLHRSITDIHGRCPCCSVLIHCSHHFVCCPLHRSITDSHGRCPCCSVLIRCYHNSVCCREIHSLNACVHCLVALIRFVVKIIVLFNTNSVRC